MRALDRRKALRQIAAAAAAWASGSLLSRAGAQSEPRTIELLARRFRYEPNEIKLKVGEPVVIAMVRGSLCAPARDSRLPLANAAAAAAI